MTLYFVATDWTVTGETPDVIDSFECDDAFEAEALLRSRRYIMPVRLLVPFNHEAPAQCGAPFPAHVDWHLEQPRPKRCTRRGAHTGLHGASVMAERQTVEWS